MSLFTDPLSTKSMQSLELGLNALTMRREVIANNIANVDVPGFKRSDTIFESEFKRMIDSERAADNEPKLSTTHPMHVAGHTPIEFSSIQPRVMSDYNSSMRNDGNNVDIEQEVTAMTKNQMQYSLLIERVGGNFRIMNLLTRLA